MISTESSFLTPDYTLSPIRKCCVFSSKKEEKLGVKKLSAPMQQLVPLRKFYSFYLSFLFIFELFFDNLDKLVDTDI